MGLIFALGLAAGFALAAPIGPVGVLCIRRALAKGRWAGFAAASGAAVADMIFGAVGLAILRSPPPDVGEATPAASLARDVMTSFSLAVTNPATMVAAAGIFAAFGTIDPMATPIEAVALVVGVLAGSGLWWLLLASLAAAQRERLTERGLPWLNRISGGVLAVFGAASIIGAASRLF
jgi:threonine/homoserine/homoserine lactone efflux protein